MEKITTDISSFENLRKGGYVYVDKTDLLWRLAVDRERRQFFISRPRRFGSWSRDRPAFAKIEPGGGSRICTLCTAVSELKYANNKRKKT